MTDRKPDTVSSPLFPWAGRVVLAVVFVMLMVAVGSSPVHAQSASPESRAPKSGTQVKRPRPTGQTGKPASAKAKPRARGPAKAATPANQSADQASPEANDKVPATPPAGTSQTVDFDADAEDVKRMEPGFELIQGSPRRARHRSLVPASPSPKDSVVNRP